MRIVNHDLRKSIKLFQRCAFVLRHFIRVRSNEWKRTIGGTRDSKVAPPAWAVTAASQIEFRRRLSIARLVRPRTGVLDLASLIRCVVVASWRNLRARACKGTLRDAILKRSIKTGYLHRYDFNGFYPRNDPRAFC